MKRVGSMCMSIRIFDGIVIQLRTRRWQHGSPGIKTHLVSSCWHGGVIIGEKPVTIIIMVIFFISGVVDDWCRAGGEVRYDRAILVRRHAGEIRERHLSTISTALAGVS